MTVVVARICYNLIHVLILTTGKLLALMQFMHCCSGTITESFLHAILPIFGVGR